MRAKIQVKRAYAPAAEDDGQKFLVDRLWPRGIKKETLRLTDWLKELAPSGKLRKCFKHDLAKWNEFQKRCRAELELKPESWRPLVEAVKSGNLTLPFSAHDLEHNSAVALKNFLKEQLKQAFSHSFDLCQIPPLPHVRDFRRERKAFN